MLDSIPILNSGEHTTKKCSHTKDLKTHQERIMSLVKLPATTTVTNSLINGEINQWHLHNPAAAKVDVPTVLIHGYAASSMAYYRTLATLSKNVKDVYVIDLPANSLSSVPPHSDISHLKINKIKVVQVSKDKENEKYVFKVAPPHAYDAQREKQVIDKLENYYLDVIEKWRRANYGLDKFNLVGHSFGGYLSFKYAIKYPEVVDKLCLVSPLGVASNIRSVNNVFDTKKEYVMDLQNPGSMLYNRQRMIPNFLFNNQLNVLKWMGPVGSKLTRKYINSAYVKVPTMDYKDYLYEYFQMGVPQVNVDIFTKLFSRNLMARDPIMDNMNRLKSTRFMMMYGDNDWMDKFSGYTLVQNINKIKNNFDRKATYVEIPDAGHNLFLDNPEDFSNNLIKFLS
ncbi:hypothetical protein NCAS_0B05120 [Naumovozyma castellii]|uniref:AB hydrolase-1 domain-containing protein n=1 Tax=Naumovozyma castellii TaxID=27288 RepID=G0V9I0_NAUCA|nr:hypothetical protein NCAS_0B05120 [Naumovozyma castellii CBS 4309]CCC68596.1 hypothetical protein NCAS_0B05120 [Naumovozyma castellii CBS 4309]